MCQMWGPGVRQLLRQKPRLDADLQHLLGAMHHQDLSKPLSPHPRKQQRERPPSG